MEKQLLTWYLNLDYIYNKLHLDLDHPRNHRLMTEFDKILAEMKDLQETLSEDPFEQIIEKEYSFVVKV